MYIGEERPSNTSPNNNAPIGTTHLNTLDLNKTPPIKATAPSGLKFGIWKNTLMSTSATSIALSKIISCFFIYFLKMYAKLKIFMSQ